MLILLCKSEDQINEGRHCRLVLRSELMAGIHDRMPVILSRDSERSLLDQSIVDAGYLKS